MFLGRSVLSLVGGTIWRGNWLFYMRGSRLSCWASDCGKAGWLRRKGNDVSVKSKCTTLGCKSMAQYSHGL
jgi:hypothetical protein